MVSGQAIKNAPGTKHLRVREDHELGGTRYRAICGANGIRSMDYTKDLMGVTCQKCLAVTKKERK